MTRGIQNTFDAIGLPELKARCVEIGDCWEWATARTENSKRFPSYRIARKSFNVRRELFAMVNGQINGALKVSPACDNMYCVNPEHQLARTQRQVVAAAGKRGSLGLPTPKRIAAMRERAKLTLEDARAIRASEETAPVLALRYGVDRSTIGYVRRGEIWRDHANPFAGLGA